jgi:E3 ubiquitin-protein ligase TM129
MDDLSALINGEPDEDYDPYNPTDESVFYMGSPELSKAFQIFNFSSTELLTTIFFCFFSICLIFPPTEAISAGLTIENMAASFLDNEGLDFVNYHIRRTCLVWIVHSFLPLVYYIALHWWWPSFWPASLSANCWLQFSILLPLTVTTYVFLLRHSRWDWHPIAKELARSCPGQNWRSAASSINTEYTRPDKFTQGPYPGRRIVVTESWILQSTVYHLHIIHQSQAKLVVENVHEHAISTDGSHTNNAGAGVQFLDIAVHLMASEQNKPLFYLRLNTMDFDEIKQRITSPLQQAQNVVIHQSLDDRFIAAFQEYISNNPHFTLPNEIEVETCLGCMRQQADIKLVKRCSNPSPNNVNNDVNGETNLADRPCQECFCRPMWCCSCLARWFAARQRLANISPHEWLEQKAPCPTCRAVFCPLDVSPIASIWNESAQT